MIGEMLLFLLLLLFSQFHPSQNSKWIIYKLHFCRTLFISYKLNTCTCTPNIHYVYNFALLFSFFYYYYHFHVIGLCVSNLIRFDDSVKTYFMSNRIIYHGSVIELLLLPHILIIIALSPSQLFFSFFSLVCVARICVVFCCCIIFFFCLFLIIVCAVILLTLEYECN